MPATQNEKSSPFKNRPLLAWLFIVTLILANVATFVVLWVLISRPGQASGPRPGSSATLFQLPQATLASRPTPRPTQVAVFAATATGTPTQPPTPTPTETSLPPTAVAAATATPLPPPTEKHVVIISIDGLRPDALSQADTPTLDNLIANGAYSPTAQTVRISETLPGHAAMLSGMTPEKNGVLWGLPYMGWPGMNGPTLFTVAHEAGLSTGMVFGKEKLNYLALPNSVDKLFGVDTHDSEVKEQAVKFIEAGLPNVLFIHFPDTDRVGHAYGWMSENQLEAITFADGLIGEIVAALNQGGYLDNTLIIVTADHGGHGSVHGDDSPIDRTIPWLAAGPGVSPGKIISAAINTYDTAATAAHALDLPIPRQWDGQPVLDIYN